MMKSLNLIALVEVKEGKIDFTNFYKADILVKTINRKKKRIVTCKLKAHDLKNQNEGYVPLKPKCRAKITQTQVALISRFNIYRKKLQEEFHEYKSA